MLEGYIVITTKKQDVGRKVDEILEVRQVPFDSFSQQLLRRFKFEPFKYFPPYDEAIVRRLSNLGFKVYEVREGNVCRE